MEEFMARPSRGPLGALGFGFFLVASLGGASDSQASCGSANCFLITGTQEEINNPGQVTLDFSFRYIPQDRMLSGTHGVDEVLVPKVDFENETIEPDHHREISTENLLVNATFGIGLTKRVSMGIELPLYQDRQHEHWDDVGTPDEAFTNADGTTGFGDVRILARVAVVTGIKNLLILSEGLKVPTGPYKLLDSEGDINEPTIQPGTGSWDPFIQVYYDHQVVPNRWDYFLSGVYTWRTENPLNYDFGNQTLLNAGFRFSPNNRLVLSLQLNGQSSPHDFFNNQMVASTGAKQIALTPGLLVTGSSGFGFYTYLAVPVYQDVNEAQLAARTAIALGITATF
jgi:hypothetical protein